MSVSRVTLSCSAVRKRLLEVPSSNPADQELGDAPVLEHLEGCRPCSSSLEKLVATRAERQGVARAQGAHHVQISALPNLTSVELLLVHRAKTEALASTRVMPPASKERTSVLSKIPNALMKHWSGN